jgi:hypothetical protein
MSRQDNAIEGSISIRPDWRHREANRAQRKDRLIFWPLVIFVGVILILLAFDHALRLLVAAALGLYGPFMLIFAAYVLWKFAIGGVKFIGGQLN